MVVKQEGLDLTAMDSTGRVQDDLFKYANGSWLARNEIPADQQGWSVWRLSRLKQDIPTSGKIVQHESSNDQCVLQSFVQRSQPTLTPDEFRARTPPTNMPEFYKAFGIKPGDKMYREEKDRSGYGKKPF